MKKFALMFMVCALSAFGCGDDDGGAEQGTLGNACYGNGTCNSGLACNGGICVGTGAPGSLGNACYPNMTCDTGLECQSGVCVDPTAPPPPGPMDGGPDGTLPPPGPDGSPPPSPDGGDDECSLDMSGDVRRPIPDACLPRCGALTGPAVAACQATLDASMFTPSDYEAHNTCLDMALDGDPTPEIIITDPASGEGSALNCRFCYYGVYDICHDMLCLAQSQTARNCDCMGADPCGAGEEGAPDGPCTAQYAALEMCLTGMGAAVNDCVVAQQARCFP